MSLMSLVCGLLAAADLHVALLQMAPAGNNVAANLDKAEAFCRDAAAQGADIALMPEMWSIGYTRFDADKPGALEEFYKDALPKDSAEIQRFANLAKQLDMAIGITYMEAYQPLPRNTITLFDRHGREVYTYAKVHTSDFKPMEASMTPGDNFYVDTLDTRVGPVQVGSMICFDRENPESARILMVKGAELILTPNACGLDELRLDQFKIRAWENVVDVAMANYPQPPITATPWRIIRRGNAWYWQTIRKASTWRPLIWRNYATGAVVSSGEMHTAARIATAIC